MVSDVRAAVPVISNGKLLVSTFTSNMRDVYLTMKFNVKINIASGGCRLIVFQAVLTHETDADGSERASRWYRVVSVEMLSVGVCGAHA